MTVSLHEFNRQRDTALFHGLIAFANGTLLTGRGEAEHWSEACAAAAQALALAGQDPAVRFGEHARPSDIADDCFTLLLLTAGGKPEGRAALGAIDRAAAGRAPTRAYYLRRAHHLKVMGDQAGAAAAERQAAALLPATVFDHFLVGQEYFRRGDLGAARRSFEDAVALQNDHFWAQCSLALCGLRQSEARTALAVCVELRPDFVLAWLLRGCVQREMRAFAGAEGDFRKAADLLKKEPNEEARYALLVNLGLLRFEEAEAVALIGTAGVVTLSAAGVSPAAPVRLIASEADRLAEAATDLEEAFRLRPNYYAAPLNLAKVYDRQGRFAESERVWQQGFRLKLPLKTQAAFRTYRGWRLLSQKRYQEAAVQFEVAASAVNHPAGALLGETLVELGRYREAIKAFDRYLARGGAPNVDVYRGRGLARLRLGLFADAIDDFGLALDRRSDAELRLQRGWAYFFLDAWTLAERDFAEAVGLDSSQPDAWAGRGLAREMLGAYRDGVADAEETLRRRPATPQTYHNVACIFALAAGRVEANLAEKERVALAARFRSRAVGAVGQTLALVPPAQRAAFWHDKVCPDHALDTIRATTEFRRWEAEYGPTQLARPK